MGVVNEGRVLEGYQVKDTPAWSIQTMEACFCADDTLKKGLLFVGAARQGKTNVMKKVASDILEQMTAQDTVVFFDVKGDYRAKFWCQGDAVLSPTEDTYLWNLFEDLKILPIGHILENQVRETVDYLFYGLGSSKEPFWTNAAKSITYCLILYLLLEADSQDDDSCLNHVELCRLMDGVTGDLEEGDSCQGVYESYRRVLNSYDQFKMANLFLPPLDSSAMGAGVLTEIIVMKQRLFVSTFGEKKVRADQVYLSPELLALQPRVVFLEFNQRYRDTCVPVFRYFVDMMIAAYLNPNRNPKGKLYFILDELAILPELKNLSFALTLGAGFGIRVVAGLQEIEQLRHTYQEHPHQAEVLLGSFQNQVIYNCDVHTAEYYQKAFGTALVQREYIKPGGGIGYQEPAEVPVLQQRTIRQLEIGQAVVHFSSRDAFIKRFPLYE